MRMRNKGEKKIIAVLIVLAFFLAILPKDTVLASRGAVSMALSTTTVTVIKGSTASFAVTIDPASEDELIGCGCGGSCGEDCCYQPDLGCVCGGSETRNFVATMSFQVADESVATAKYANGKITITGYNVGQTTIQATANLRHYDNSAPQTITVTVKEAGSTTDTPTSYSQSSTSAGGPSTGGSTSGQLKSSNTSDQEQSSSKQESTISEQSSQSQMETALEMDSNESTTQTQTDNEVPLIKGAAWGKTELLEIEGRDKNVTFRQNDGAGNMVYSWTFNGLSVTKPDDLLMDIDISDKSETVESNVEGIDKALYLTFAHSGELPGEAKIKIYVGDYYKEGEVLTLYYYDPEGKKSEKIASELNVVKGYVEFSITHCSEYFLAPQEVSGFMQVAMKCGIGIAVLLCVGAGGLFILRKKKRKSDLLIEEEDTQL